MSANKDFEISGNAGFNEIQQESSTGLAKSLTGISPFVKTGQTQQNQNTQNTTTDAALRNTGKGSAQNGGDQTPAPPKKD